MNERTSLDRREFTVAAVLAALSGVAIAVTGCGGGSGSPASPSTPPTGGGGASDKTGTVASNHGHRAVVTGAQLTAANAVSLDIRGDSDHPHTVALAASEVAAISGGQRVSKESSSDAGHSHTVTFN